MDLIDDKCITSPCTVDNVYPFYMEQTLTIPTVVDLGSKKKFSVIMEYNPERDVFIITTVKEVD